MTRDGLERSYLQTALFDLQGPSRHGFDLRGTFKHSWHSKEDPCALNILFSLFFFSTLKKGDFLVSGSWWAFKSSFLLWRLLQKSLARLSCVQRSLPGLAVCLSLLNSWSPSQNQFLPLCLDFTRTHAHTFLLTYSYVAIYSPGFFIFFSPSCLPLLLFFFFLFWEKLKEKKWHKVFLWDVRNDSKGFSRS